MGGGNCDLDDDDPFHQDPEATPLCQEAWFTHMESQKKSLEQAQKWQADIQSLLAMMHADIEGFTAAQRRRAIRLHRTAPYPVKVY